MFTDHLCKIQILTPLTISKQWLRFAEGMNRKQFIIFFCKMVIDKCGSQTYLRCRRQVFKQNQFLAHFKTIHQG